MLKITGALFFVMISLQCGSNGTVVQNSNKDISQQPDIISGAEQLALYNSMIKDRRFGMVINQTSIVDDQLLPDTLISLGLYPYKIFTPEHGFSGTASAGEKIDNSHYRGIEVISLYGKNKKPVAKDLDGIDIMLFDLQDVGVRFYTYISTLHYMMEACAENSIPLVILDRPNPNGYYVDGPVLDPRYSSFVGMHPVPVVYGMTIGEYGNMINGEKWLENDVACEITIIPCENYDHSMTFPLEVNPSPNLPNHLSVLLYPSLCFFEGTEYSVGRGTDFPFQVFGHPEYMKGTFTFVPKANEGAKYPKFGGKECLGIDLRELEISELWEGRYLRLNWLLDAYNQSNRQTFFLKNNFFDKLAGTDSLRKMILDGHNEADIRDTWKDDLTAFRKIRERYLIYP